MPCRGGASPAYLALQTKAEPCDSSQASGWRPTFGAATSKERSRPCGGAAPRRPAPQSAFESRPSTRAFSRCLASKPDAEIEAFLTREIRFDPDVWIVEVEDRAGRHFLDRIIA